jgi:hypothetical protein
MFEQSEQLQLPQPFALVAGAAGAIRARMPPGTTHLHLPASPDRWPNCSSSQSSTRRLMIDRLIISQCPPAPSLAEKRSRVFGQRSASKNAGAAASRRGYHCLLFDAKRGETEAERSRCAWRLHASRTFRSWRRWQP